MFYSTLVGWVNVMSASQENTGNAQPPEKAVTEEAILKVSKEVVVKFIEVRSLSPAKFAETFREIHRSVRDAVRS